MKNIFKFISLGFIIISSFLPSCKKEEVSTLTTSDVTNITGTTATCGGTITDGDLVKIVERGICWSKENTPTIEDDCTIELGGSATFISNMTGLNEGTTYYVRAYAINSVGVGYGMELAFRTLGQVPSASTESATNITPTSATLNGTVNANDLSTEVYFLYFWTGCGTSDTHVNATPSPLTGSTTVNVSANITGLTPSTTYYYRISAFNILGTSVGDEVSFKTQEPYITFNPDLAYGSVTDVEDNIYKTIQIGTQTWMAENLKTTKYNNKEAIPLKNSLAWITLTAPAYCWCNMDGTTYKPLFGALYNWYTINTGKLCPSGWHVPTYDEWSTLLNNLGDTSSAYLKIREVGTMNWISPNTGVTNASGFTALPGGMRRQMDSYFVDKGNRAFWWSSTVNPDYPSELAIIATIKSNNSVVAGESFDFKNGFSVRCLKDN